MLLQVRLDFRMSGKGEVRKDVEKAVCAGGNTQLVQPVDITTAWLRGWRKELPRWVVEFTHAKNFQDDYSTNP